MHRHVIEVGQRFEQLGQWRLLWQVEAIDRDSSRILHVTLREVTDPSNKRTLAPAVLFDRRRYRPVEPSERQPSGEPLRQRRRARRRPAGPAATAGAPAKAALPAPRFSMVIESRSANGYIMTCQGLNREHRFLVKNPGPIVECPFCGNSIRSLSLLHGQVANAARKEAQAARAPLEAAGQPGVVYLGPRRARRGAH